VTGRVERFPRVPGRLALKLHVVPFTRTLAAVFLEPIEQVGPEKPKERGDHQTGGVFDNAGPVGVQAKHLGGGDQERRGPQQRPKPTELDEIPIEERVAVGEIDSREAHEVAHHGRDQQNEVDEQTFVGGQEQIFPANEQEHGEQYAEYGSGFSDQLRAFRGRPHAQPGRYVIRFDGSRPCGPFGDDHRETEPCTRSFIADSDVTRHRTNVRVNTVVGRVTRSARHRTISAPPKYMHPNHSVITTTTNFRRSRYLGTCLIPVITRVHYQSVDKK